MHQDRIQSNKQYVRAVIARVVLADLKLAHDFKQVDRVRQWARKIKWEQGLSMPAGYVESVALIETCGEKRPLLVAIDGQSAAGKSTLARYIQQQLPNVTIVRADDFYRVMDEQERAALDPEGGYNRYYDWQRLEQQVLEPFAQTLPARYQRYNWHENSLGEWVELSPQGIVVVEGVYTLRPALRHYYDVKIFVATKPHVRMARQAERSDPWTWVARWEAAEMWYLKHHAPAAVADLVLEHDA